MNKVGTFFIGLVVGATVLMWITIKSPVVAESQAQEELIAQCEQSLPRTEKCVMIAVPNQSMPK